MKSLETFTDEELEEELRLRNLEGSVPQPIPREEIDITKLYDYCVEQINYLAKHRYDTKDYRYYTYEIAMETIYGENIWDWINGIRA